MRLLKASVCTVAALILSSGFTAFAAKAEVDPSVYSPLKRDVYPKTFAKWGEAGVKRINILRKKAALLADKSSECNGVEISELSDSRSSPPNDIVIFVDCKNGKRFYLNEDDVAVGSNPVSQEKKMSTLTDDEVLSSCRNEVRSSLRFASTMSEKWGSKDIYRAPMTGNVVVTFDFDAKNNLGNVLPYKARCVFSDKGMDPPQITGR